MSKYCSSVVQKDARFRFYNGLDHRTAQSPNSSDPPFPSHSVKVVTYMGIVSVSHAFLPTASPNFFRRVMP